MQMAESSTNQDLRLRSPSGSLLYMAAVSSLIAGVALLLSMGSTAAAQATAITLLCASLCYAISRIAKSLLLALSLIFTRMAIVTIAALYIQPFLEVVTGTDAQLYHAAGLEISHSILAHGALSGSVEGWGTNTYAIFTGIWYAVCGASPVRIMIFNSLVGAIGTLMIYRTFVETYGKPHWALKYLILFDPAVLYWSSTHGKDPSVLFFLGLLFRSLSRMLRTGTTRSLFLYFLALTGIFAIRPQVALLCALCVLIVLALLRLRSSLPNAALRFCFLSSIASVALITGVVLVAYGQLKEFSGAALLGQLSSVVGSQSYGGTALNAPQFSTWTEFVAYLPLEMIAVLFRPFPWEQGNMLIRLAALHQLLLSMASLLILRGMMVRLKPNHFKNYRLDVGASMDSLGWFLLAYWMGFIVLYGAISGNLGTLAREKIQLAPFVWCAAFAISPSLRASERGVRARIGVHERRLPLEA